MNFHMILTQGQARNSQGAETITTTVKRVTAESFVAMTGGFHGPISSLQGWASRWLDLQNQARDSRIIAAAQTRLEAKRRALGISTSMGGIR